MKLIPGKMNVLYTIYAPGYAKGAELLKPKRKKKPFNPVIKRPVCILRKAS